MTFKVLLTKDSWQDICKSPMKEFSISRQDLEELMKEQSQLLNNRTLTLDN